MTNNEDEDSEWKSTQELPEINQQLDTCGDFTPKNCWVDPKNHGINSTNKDSEGPTSHRWPKSIHMGKKSQNPKISERLRVRTNYWPRHYGPRGVFKLKRVEHLGLPSTFGMMFFNGTMRSELPASWDEANPSLWIANTQLLRGFVEAKVGKCCDFRNLQPTPCIWIIIILISLTRISFGARFEGFRNIKYDLNIICSNPKNR